MSARASLLAVAALAAGIVGFLGVGCTYCEVTTDFELGEPIDSGVDADLHAIAVVGDQVGDRYYEHLAVGDGGTIVAWGEVYTDGEPERLVEVSSHGDEALRAAWIARPSDEYYSYAPSTSWWVVGDAGTIASSDNRGATWNPITLPGVDGDLHAITGFDGRPVIVGDEIVLVRLADGTWIQPPTPDGGWGSLRGVAFDGEQLHAVGLAGRAWATTDPAGEWTAEPTGVDVDLLAIELQGSAWDYDFDGKDELLVVGAAGTVLIQNSDGFEPYDTNLSVDLIDVHGNCILAADGEVYEFASMNSIDSIPGAEAIDCFYDMASVGEGGLVMAAPVGDDC